MTLDELDQEQIAAACRILERAGTEEGVDARTLKVEADLAAPVTAALRAHLSGDSPP